MRQKKKSRDLKDNPGMITERMQESRKKRHIHEEKMRREDAQSSLGLRSMTRMWRKGRQETKRPKRGIQEAREQMKRQKERERIKIGRHKHKILVNRTNNGGK